MKRTLRHYIFDWHPYGEKHELYLSGTDAEFKKLIPLLRALSTPEIPNSVNHQYKEILQKSFEEILLFVKQQTKLRIHPAPGKLHTIIFEADNKYPYGNNLICFCEQEPTCSCIHTGQTEPEPDPGDGDGPTNVFGQAPMGYVE